MKKNSSLSVADILAQTSAAQAHEITRVGGGPIPHEEREASAEALRNMKIMGVCIACSTPATMDQFELCECGGMVCKTCQAIEEDGVCDHEPPDFIRDDED